MTSIRKILGFSTTMAATLALVAACGTSAGENAQDSDDGKVHLSVVSLIPGSEKAAFKAFDDQVAAFEKAHPDVDVTPQEYEWKATTFAAQLAGGTLPTVFEVPFTDAQSLIQNRQIADITTEAKKLPYAGSFNPDVLAEMTDPQGNIYALPDLAYGSGLQYNRELFAAAGLDPDKPPTTWQEVRTDAKAIADKTGAAGFAMMGKSNTGGWNLATLTYALGGRIESTDASGATTATVNNPATKQALQMLHSMRWDDNSMGSDFLLDWSGMNQAFAAGKVGMYISGSDVYSALKQTNNIDPKTYGLTTLPMSDSPDAGLLGGGTLAAVKATATPKEKQAAVAWIDFHYLSKYTDQQRATDDAQTQAANKQPVGVPQLPILDRETLTTYESWISDYVDVPLTQMKGFTGGVFDQKLTPEPAVNTQEVYGAMDSVVQTVMTDQGADVDALLTQANTDVQKAIDKSAKS